MGIQFVVEVKREDHWVEVPVLADRANQYVRTTQVVAIPMNEPFRICFLEDDSVDRSTTGRSGDYLILDDGKPSIVEGLLFRSTHTQIPLIDDDLVRLRVAILNLLEQRVEFDSPEEGEQLADELLAVIATIEVSP